MAGKAFMIKVKKGKKGDDGGTLIVSQGDEDLLVADYHDGEKIEIKGIKHIAAPATLPVFVLVEPQGNASVILVTFA